MINQTFCMPPAQLTKRDYAEIAEILNGVSGTRNGTNYWFDGSTLRLNWITDYTPTTSRHEEDWKTIEEDYTIDGLLVDEDLSLWNLEQYKTAENEWEREDAKSELEEIFLTAAL